VATLALAAVGLLALLVFVLFGALVELFRDVRQVRDVLGVLDRPLEVDLGGIAGTAPSEHGLPAALDAEASALVLFLSEKCATCRVLAAAVGASLPAGLWVVLEARSAESATAFLDSHGMSPATCGGRLVVDVEGRIAASVGLDTTPVGFRVEEGRLTRATTVPSTRYLFSVLPQPIRLKSEFSRQRTMEMAR